MYNDLLWVGFAIANFLLLMGMYKLFGKMGIFVWVGVATIIANLQVIINVDLFGLHATLGNIMYGTIFLGTDALNEIYGKKSARNAVWMGFYVLLSSLILMNIALLFIPNADDFGYAPVQTIVQFWGQVVIASLAAFIVSQLLDVTIFQKIKAKLPSNKWLWVRNNGSTMVSQLVDSFIFVSIAFIGKFSFDIILEIFISTYLIKVMVAALDTPFLYLMKKIQPLDLLNEKG